MELKVITLDTAKLAKDKGFNWEVNSSYDTHWNLFEKEVRKRNYNGWDQGDYSAPTQSLLQKWLREVHNIIVEVRYEDLNAYVSRVKLTNYVETLFVSKIYETYEEALEEGLQEALNQVK